MNKKNYMKYELIDKEFINIIAAEALIRFQDNLVAKNICSVDAEADYSNKPQDCKVGDSLWFNVNNFDTELPAEIKNITIEKHFDFTCELGERELELDFEQFSEEVIQPISYVLASKVDKYTFGKFLECKKVYSSDDLFGAVSGTGNKDLALIRKAANFQQLGKDRFCLLDPTADSTLMGQTWFTGAQNRGNDDILRYGESGTTMGMDFFCTVNWTDHTDKNGCEYHGAVFNKNSLGLAMPLLRPTKGKTCCSIVDTGVSLKVTIDEDNGIKKLSIECMVSSFLINSDNMILLGENKF